MLDDMADDGPLPTRAEVQAEFLELCRREGLPLPEMNVVVEGVLVDAVWRDRHLVVQLEGYRDEAE